MLETKAHDGESNAGSSMTLDTVDKNAEDTRKHNMMKGIESNNEEINIEDELVPGGYTPNEQVTFSPYNLRRNIRSKCSNATLIHYNLTQYSLKKVLNKFVKKVEEAVGKYFDSCT
mmetsp:Transcript_63335/g.187177  ORF Transcript_63335/g.187177 Transcript_63335/m.187177 type:complete len:116 (-) Transcript_63335:764-1111(-)